MSECVSVFEYIKKNECVVGDNFKLYPSAHRGFVLCAHYYDIYFAMHIFRMVKYIFAILILKNDIRIRVATMKVLVCYVKIANGNPFLNK